MLCFFVPRAQDFYIFLTLHEFYIPQISNFTLPPYTEIRKKTCQIKVRKILMTIFNVFSLLGGLALFLFGMDIMGKALEKTLKMVIKISSLLFDVFLMCFS